MNILQATSSNDSELLTSSIVSVFRHIWADSWGPRTEYTLHNTVAALLDTPQSTLLDVYRMLVDEAFRQAVVNNIQDFMVCLFWEQVFAKYTDRFRQEVISPIQNKVGQLLTGSFLRNIVGQANGSCDIEKILNGNSIFLVNLSKGKIGEDRANLLGSIIITKLYLAALERQAIPESERQDFYLYIDEAHSFGVDTFSSILAESRKFHLNLTLANQYLEQLPLKMRHSIFGNIGSWIVFRIGAEDAQHLEPEFAPYIKPEIMTRQANHRIAYKLLVNGVAALPATTATPPPLKLQGDEANPEKIIATSRQRFGRRRKLIEEQIANRWKGSSLSLQARQRP